MQEPQHCKKPDMVYRIKPLTQEGTGKNLENQKFKVVVGYMVSLGPVWST